MKAAIYARVSTAEQDPDMQVRELREFCARRGWELAGEFTDVGESGAKDRRPQLDALLAVCRRRGVDVVVVYRFDRFARSLAFLVQSLQEFRALGIDFVSLHEAVDTSTPNGRLVFAIFGAIAEFERELIRERVVSGIAAARARGKYIGRPRRVVDVEEIARLRKQNVSWYKIEQNLGISARTAKRRLGYSGKTPIKTSAASR
jgi:DNA invertase Pin-like site-specific DNA recombinase